MEDNKEMQSELNKELKELLSETRMLVKTIDNKRDEVAVNTEKSLQELGELAKQFADENVQIQCLPKKMKSEIGAIIPVLAAEIHELSNKQVKELELTHRQNVEEHKKAITDAALNLKRIKEEICQVDGMRIKRYFISLGSIMLISVLASLGSSYAMIRQFPHNVHIDSPNQVEVQNSDVSYGIPKVLKLLGKRKRQEGVREVKYVIQ